MAFQPHGMQEQQNRRILQEVAERKRQLLNQQGGSGLSHANRPEGSNSVLRNPNEPHQMVTMTPKQALEHVQSVSSGFFISQDSSFGNMILPVIPRFEPEQENTNKKETATQNSSHSV